MDLKTHWRVLIVDDDEEDYLLVRSVLGSMKQVRAESDWAKTVREALQDLQSAAYDAVLIDYYLGSERGLDLIQSAHEAGIAAPMILLSGSGTYEIDREAMQSGALYYLDKNDLNPPEVERTIRYAIERKAIEQSLKQREDKLRLLAELSKNIVEAGLELRGVLDTIAQRVSETLKDAIIIWMQSGPEGTLEPAAAYHPDPRSHAQMIRVLNQKPVAVPEGRLAAALQDERARAQPRVDLPGEDNPAFVEWLDQFGVADVLSVPMQVHAKSLGRMVLMRSRSQAPFDDSDRDFYQDLADRASLSIEMARLYVEEADHSRYLQALHAANQALSKTIEIDTLIQKILEAVLEAVPKTEEAILFLPLTESEDCCIQGIRCPRDTKKCTTLYLPPDQPIGVLTRQAVQERQPLTAASWPVQLLPAAADRKGAVLAVPLILDQKVLGALTLIADWPDTFEPKDVTFLEDFAVMATTALNNARLHMEVQRLAVTDPLTNLLNRRGFFHQAEREFLRFQRFEKPLSVLLMDIDHFKSINDRFGHDLGDQVLRALATSCLGRLRKVDVVGRLGGDEFIVVLPDTQASRAKKIAERIRRCFESMPFGLEDGSLAQFTISLGLCQANERARSFNDLIPQADAALYAAKQKGGNRVEVHVENQE